MNDTLEINVIHVSVPMAAKRSKRSEVNLEKHLKKKKSIIRIQNEDELCMVAKAKLDIAITSWLVSAYDFYSRVVKDR